MNRVESCIEALVVFGTLSLIFSFSFEVKIMLWAGISAIIIALITALIYIKSGKYRGH